MAKKIIFIAPYPFGQAPSQRFRFEQYIQSLHENGFSTEFHPFLDDKGWKTLYEDGSFFKKSLAMFRSFWRRFFLLFKLKKFDSIFIHREASMIGPPFIEWMIAKVLRRKYIYDFDDAIWLPNYSEANASFHKLKAYGKVKKIIKWADQVVVGNNHLKEFALKYNDSIKIIPTTVDLDNVHKINTIHNKSEIIIGWTGTHTTAKYLNFIVPVLEKLEKQFEFKFRVISNHSPDIKLNSLEYIKWNKKTEIKDLSEINIGIMPMDDNKWTRGKCGFKSLQYMSLQIPAIMSPVGINNQIIQNGKNGFLCSSASEWEEVLTTLLNDCTLREKIGVAGQETVKEKYSVNSNKENYLKLFK